jgi:hypothetical protein
MNEADISGLTDFPMVEPATMPEYDVDPLRISTQQPWAREDEDENAF